jgi:hypothetical protein
MKVFWSWQSDHDGKISRHFVRKAMATASEELAEDPAIEEPFELRSTTIEKGSVGRLT